MNLSFITQPCSIENPTGQNLEGTAQWIELEQMQIAREDDFSQGIWSINAPQTDWKTVENMCMNLLQTHSKDLQIMAWWVRARLIKDGLTGLQSGFEGLLSWINHWWATGHPKEAQTVSAIKLGRLRWLDHQLSLLIETKYQPSPSDEDSAYAIRTLINDIETLVQTTNSQAWGIFAKTQERLPVRAQLNLVGATTRFAGQMANSHLRIEQQEDAGTEMGSTPPNRHLAVRNIQQALLYFEEHEPQHPVKAMLQRALVWINKPMDEWLSELVSDELSRKKIQDVLGLKLSPNTRNDN
jgi:predicted component of type VI protein secretion system